MSSVKNFAGEIIENVSKVIVGKEEKIQKILSVMLTGGHALLNDVPGVGKTMLARSLSISISAEFKRIQCTPDLLPSDVTGLNILDIKSNEFKFRPGPVFSDILLADEINRTTPRTQSALLEAMGEGQVSIDGTTHKLSKDFFVIATQNPIEFEGTFPLPEAQLDRFSICLSMGYPDTDSEFKMLKGLEHIHPVEIIEPVANLEDFNSAKNEVKEVDYSPDIMRYIVSIIDATRKHKDLALGSSPRGSIFLMNLSRALAAIKGRDFVIPDDVKFMAPDVLSHRILLTPEARLMKRTTREVIGEILENIEVPMINERE
ncbi:MAG: AAA family ATPase [Kosmotogaceae bacterium]|jgi:MoxR-like ATPase